MKSTMRECVGRAICRAAGNDWSEDFERATALELADAALEALLFPTAEMVDAAVRAWQFRIKEKLERGTIGKDPRSSFVSNYMEMIKTAAIKSAADRMKGGGTGLGRARPGRARLGTGSYDQMK